MDTLADPGVPSRAGVLSGRRICQRGIVDAMARSGRPPLDRMGPESAGRDSGTDHGLRNAGACRRGGAGLGRRRTFGAAVRRLGGRHASVVCAGLPRPADADAGRAGGTPAMGAAGACRPGDCCCGRRRCGACLASADNQLSQLPAVLGSDLSGRDLLARWDFGWPSAGADRRRCRHRARDSARPALLPDQHGRIARRDRAEQFSAHRGVARIRRGTSCGSGRRGARGDTSGAAIAVAAAGWPGRTTT